MVQVAQRGQIMGKMCHTIACHCIKKAVKDLDSQDWQKKPSTLHLQEFAAGTLLT